jgi:hypothetical protein
LTLQSSHGCRFLGAPVRSSFSSNWFELPFTRFSFFLYLSPFYL